MRSRRFPVNLSESMAVCDANYIRILKLLPVMNAEASREITLPAPVGAESRYRSHLVVIQVVEKFRYTTTLSVRLMLAGEAQVYYQPPQFMLRLYHDASTAEVVSYQSQGKMHEYARPGEAPEFMADEKQQVNALLADWLALCLEQGMGQHQFIATDYPDAESGQLKALL